MAYQPSPAATDSSAPYPGGRRRDPSVADAEQERRKAWGREWGRHAQQAARLAREKR